VRDPKFVLDESQRFEWIGPRSNNLAVSPQSGAFARCVASKHGPWSRRRMAPAGRAPPLRMNTIQSNASRLDHGANRN
jgi:hypothetical protein